MNFADKPYIIGETAFHHQGDTDFLKNLIEAGVSSNIDALKFHLLFDIEDYIIPGHEAISILEQISIPEEKWLGILSSVRSDIDIILLCNDIKSLTWVNSVQNVNSIKAIEIHSTGLNDIFLLEESLKFNGTVILGVGGSTFEEIKYAVDFLISKGKKDILLMHGFQNYPTRYQDVNFERMNFLKKAFNLPVGYADHTDPLDQRNAIISSLPQVMGFSVLEKHFTTKFGEKRIDSQAAVSLDILNEIIELSSEIYLTRGTTSFDFSDAEKKYGNTGPMKKAIVARRKIEKGNTIQLNDIAFKRTEKSSSLRQIDLSKIIGAKALIDIEPNVILDFSNTSFQFNTNNFNQFYISK